MKLKNITNLITSKVGRKLLVVRKHSPALLFAGGVVGIVGTVVLASRATLKLEEILKENEIDRANRELVRDHPNYSEDDYRQDGIRIYIKTAGKIVKLYGPAVLLGMASIGALTGSHVLLTRRNIAITAAYAALDRGFREYRERVTKELGKDKDRQFLYNVSEVAVVEETPEGPVTKTLYEPGEGLGSPYARFFDETNPNYQREHMYNQLFLQCQQNWANNMLMAKGYVFLNDIYEMLGFPRTPEGQLVGWLKDNPEGDGYIDFGIFEGDNFSGIRFVKGYQDAVLLDFNVDGIVYDKI